MNTVVIRSVFKIKISVISGESLASLYVCSMENFRNLDFVGPVSGFIVIQR